MNETKNVFLKNIDDVVDRVISELSFKDKTKIANMSEADLVKLNMSWGIYIRNEFRLEGNDPLLQSLKAYAGVNTMTSEQASYIIIKELWEKLQNANVLKIVK
ncbi:MAG: hypothetical protein JRE28_03610 [Deltaproteobacteria bacterium]|nr:hypothetical protein [Deltaproteobacteria bacterium]